MSTAPTASQFLIYRSENGSIKIDVRFENESVWLSQQQMADLFQSTQQNISLHLQNIYEEGELRHESTHKEFLWVRLEGAREVQRRISCYNLDVIISVGYRVKSRIATQFRIWATQHLREFIIKGFVLDDERLKNPDRPFDYFEELLLTMTPRPRRAFFFSRRCKIKCTGPSQAKRPRKLSKRGPIAAKPIWD